MKQAYLSRLAGEPLTDFLYNQGYNINYVTEAGLVSGNTTHPERILQKADKAECCLDPRIATHADMYMCQLGLWDEAGIFIGNRSYLMPEYPEDIIYNAVCTRDFFIHFLKYTEESLMDAVMTWRRDLVLDSIIHAVSENFEELSGDEEEMKIVGVNQGYTRCTCLPVDNSSFITSDAGLADVLENQGASVLLIEQGHILLPGFPYGFIGGCAGNIYVTSSDAQYSRDKAQHRAIVFNGDLSAHPDFERITEFIRCRNILPVWFDDYPLEDIGSILVTE